MNQKSNKVTFKFIDDKEVDREYEYISALAKEFHRPIRIETDFNSDICLSFTSWLDKYTTFMLLLDMSRISQA